MQILLEQAANRRERPVSGLPPGLHRKPRRLQAAHQRGDRQDQGGEAPKGSGQEAPDHGEPETFGQRARGPEESGLCGGTLAAVGGSRNPQEAGLLWQIRQDTQSCDQS